MSTRHTVTRTGPDHWQGQRPSTDAQRRYAHGPLVPMADKWRMALGDVVWLVGIGVGVVMAVVAGVVLIGGAL